jgi:hypothetical protein
MKEIYEVALFLSPLVVVAPTLFILIRMPEEAPSESVEIMAVTNPKAASVLLVLVLIAMLAGWAVLGYRFFVT